MLRLFWRNHTTSLFANSMATSEFEFDHQSDMNYKNGDIWQIIYLILLMFADNINIVWCLSQTCNIYKVFLSNNSNWKKNGQDLMLRFRLPKSGDVPQLSQSLVYTLQTHTHTLFNYVEKRYSTLRFSSIYATLVFKKINDNKSWN